MSENSFGFEKISSTNEIPDHSDAQGEIQIIEQNLNFDKEIDNSPMETNMDIIILGLCV